MTAWCRKLWEIFTRRACCCCNDCCPGVLSDKQASEGFVQPTEINYIRRGRASRQTIGSTSSEHSGVGATAGSGTINSNSGGAQVSPAPQPPSTGRSDSVFLPETDGGVGAPHRPAVHSGSATFAGPTSPITWRAHRQSVQPRATSAVVASLDDAGYAPPTSAPAGTNCPPCLVGPTSLQRYRFSYGPELTADQIRKDLYHQPYRASSSSSSVDPNTASSATSDSPPPPPPPPPPSQQPPGHPVQHYPAVNHHQPLVQRSSAPLDDAGAVAGAQAPVLNLHLTFLHESSSLAVRVISAENLPPPPATPRPLASNPYVRARLLRCEPAGGAIGPACSTAVQKRTQNPLWNEILTFPLPPNGGVVGTGDRPSIAAVLEVQVRDYDQYSRQWTIGRKEIDLKEFDLSQTGQPLRVTLQPLENSLEELGEAYISLHYLPSAGRLSCNVIKLRNIHQRDPARRPDLYVKVVFMDDKKVVKTKKSGTKKSSVSPVFNELFRCDVAEERLPFLTLIISVYDARGTSKDELLGRVVMGKYAPYQNSAGAMAPADESEQRVWQYLLSRKMAPTEPRWFAFKAKRQLYSS